MPDMDTLATSLETIVIVRFLILLMVIDIDRADEVTIVLPRDLTIVAAIVSEEEVAIALPQDFEILAAAVRLTNIVSR